MRTRKQTAAGVALVALLLTPAASSGADQHSVESIVAALKSPISAKAVAQAREEDDKIMAGGDVEGARVYLVTDERSSRVNALVGGLLRAAGEDQAEWVVRVLDTDPPVINAFVMGGKYVYVYTGLLAQEPSDDELAFILSHELGHSLLKHQERQENDASSTWAAVANLAALLSEKNREVLSNVATSITSSYNRVDEQEADAIASCIARRAGYDPLRGADFFTRSKREQDKAREQREAQLAGGKSAYEQALANCVKNKNLFNSATSYQTQKNADIVNSLCAEAEAKRLAYNEIVEHYNAAVVDERRNLLLGTHPQDQARVATIAALADFLAGRRDASTLEKFEQAPRVIAALQQTDSPLLKAAPPMPAPAASGKANGATRSSPSLEEQLQQLKRALDQGLITKSEYERKRQEILSRY
jgi:Zn-dependent protease with chaperone function